ncbi:ribose 1,5-bisphosphokinase [Psychromonas sp.]|nr:ribose 1,5-bisphosphokinase [Psychromonas sp.]
MELGQGKLFYLIGPSGSGKDSLLNSVRSQLIGTLPLLIAHRYITRSATATGENHIALSDAEFLQRQQGGLFAMHWQANSCAYALGCEVHTWLDKGFSVLVNGSRGQLELAQRTFGERLQVIVVTVTADILAQRLLARGRENHEQITARLLRNEQLQQQLSDGFWRLDNSGLLQDSVDKLNEYLLQQIKRGD